MSSDPDITPRPPSREPAAPPGGPADPKKVRFARQILAFVACLGLTAFVDGLYHLLTVGLWQYFVITGVSAGFTAVVAHAYASMRPHPSDQVIERVFATIAVALLLVPLWFEQVETMLAASYIFFILVAAPRLLSLERADRWIYIACATGILCSAAELLPLPTRLPAALQYNLPFELTVLVAMVCFALLAFRDSRRFPLRSKLVLAFLVVALGPLAIISYDSSTKVVSHQQLRDSEDLADRTATTAALWTQWFHHQRQRLAWVVDGAVMADVCAGDPVELERMRARMQPLQDDLRGAALWASDGRRLVSVGTPPEHPLPPGATIGHGADGGLVLATPACDGGSLGVALANGTIDLWVAAAAQRHKAAVLVRDAAGSLLAGTAKPALLAALPAHKDLSSETYSLDRTLVAIHEPAPPRLLQHSGQMIAVAAVEPAGWSLALLRDESGLQDAIARQKREVHVFTLLAAMFATIAALLLGHALAAPLRRLSAALTRFSGGETSVRADVKSQDEIGGLADQFNRMAEQVGGLLHSLAEQTQRLQAEVGVRSAQEEKLQVLNADLSTARDQAMAANRAKSTFLAHMSHELRTPLNAIIGYGELIEDICEERRFKDIADDTRKIVRSAHHLLTIINDILDLSKIEAGKLDMVVAEFDVGDLVREVAETIAPLISDNKNTLSVRIDAADTAMRSDRTKLRQTLLNLLSNAAKFTENGTIELHLRHETVAGVPCHIFRVVDQGVGIPEAALATLFDPFTQVVYPQVRKRAGTGLGLAITRRLCWMMGGEIDVESVSGKGSTFTVWIPSVYRNLGSNESWRPLRNKRGPGQLSGPMPTSKP